MTWIKKLFAAIKRFFSPGPPVEPGGGLSPPVQPDNPTPSPPDAGGPGGLGGPVGFDLRAVKWLHGAGADIASWPVTAILDRVEIRLPYICSYGMRWPKDWQAYGAKRVQASLCVIALINGRWFGACWEAGRVGMQECRPLEGLTKPQSDPANGPFAQVERDPFWRWHPAKGELIGFMLTSWIRAGVLQPYGRSEVRWARWPS